MMRIVSSCLAMAIFWMPAMAGPQHHDSGKAAPASAAEPILRELNWD